MTQFLKKVFMHTTVYNYGFFFKDIFYKYLKISKLFNCQKLAIYKKFDCYIKTKKKFQGGDF